MSALIPNIRCGCWVALRPGKTTVNRRKMIYGPMSKATHKNVYKHIVPDTHVRCNGRLELTISADGSCSCGGYYPSVEITIVCKRCGWAIDPKDLTLNKVEEITARALGTPTGRRMLKLTMLPR